MHYFFSMPYIHLFADIVPGLTLKLKSTLIYNRLRNAHSDIKGERTMRAFVAILILAVAGYLAYTYLYQPLTDEAKNLKSLEDQFDEASRALLNAERMAGSTGLDTTSDAEMAVRKVKRVENELRALRSTLSEPEVIEKAEQLEKKIKNFYRKIGLD